MADGRLGSEPGLDLQTRATESIRKGRNPKELEKETGDDGGSLSQQAGVNHEGDNESTVNLTHDQGSRFRALANLDLNVDLESVTEEE